MFLRLSVKNRLTSSFDFVFSQRKYMSFPGDVQ